MIVIVWTPIVFLVWIVTTPFDKGRYATGYTFRRLCVLHQWLNPMWKFKTSGQLPANKRNPYVMVSNHESFVDMLLLSHLKMEMKYLSKESFLRIPLVGWMMKMSGDVSVLRGDRSSGAAALIVCEKWLKDRKGRRVSKATRDLQAQRQSSPSAPSTPPTIRHAQRRSTSRTQQRQCCHLWCHVVLPALVQALRLPTREPLMFSAYCSRTLRTAARRRS